jgi:hypothetical protein
MFDFDVVTSPAAAPRPTAAPAQPQPQPQTATPRREHDASGTQAADCGASSAEGAKAGRPHGVP